MFTVKTTVEVSKEIIDCMLCCAFEGGSNYWARSPDNNAKEVGAEYAFQAPLFDKGYFIIQDMEDEDKEYKVTKAVLEKGLQIMAKDYERHFKDAVNENDDAITGDVFLQCCVFGEVIYG